MSAHSTQTVSGRIPARISSANTWQPMQSAKTDSSVAATTSAASRTVVTVVQPSARASTPAVVIAAPMPCAKRFGGPGDVLRRAEPRRDDLRGEQRQRAEARAGEHAGPEAERERDQQPVPARGERDDAGQRHAAGHRARGLLVDDPRESHPG